MKSSVLARRVETSGGWLRSAQVTRDERGGEELASNRETAAVDGDGERYGRRLVLRARRRMVRKGVELGNGKQGCETGKVASSRGTSPQATLHNYSRSANSEKFRVAQLQRPIAALCDSSIMAQFNFPSCVTRLSVMPNAQATDSKLSLKYTTATPTSYISQIP